MTALNLESKLNVYGPFPNPLKRFQQNKTYPLVPAFEPSPGANATQESNDDLTHPSKRRKLDTGHGLRTRNAHTDATALPAHPKGEITAGAHLTSPTLGLRPSSPTITSIHRASHVPPRPLRCPRKKPSFSTSQVTPKPTARSVKGYVAEPPLPAPHYPDHTSADFFPWNGHHAEDGLNEATTRNGFYDKPPATQHESITARPFLWGRLKHNSGLETLSSLFDCLLLKRELSTRISSESTFKLPPRVTLTDAKRENWLKGLANPSTSLRSLSRSIPHGIRGKTLLEHCLKKSVPISRAVWLAKCVGANEVRAFKRKGTGSVINFGGEIKWIKDWTTNVEDFMDSIVAACGTTSWRVMIDYGLRLTLRLSSAQLLDQDQYFEWVVRSTAHCDVNRLLAWLLLVNTFWRGIIRRRRLGRQLVLVLLEHLTINGLNGPDGKKLPHVEGLTTLLRRIMLTAPACFFVTNHWRKYERLLADTVVGDGPFVEALFHNIRKRNLRVQHHLYREPSYSDRALRQRLIAMFEHAVLSSALVDLADSCLLLTNEHTTIVDCCLQWCSGLERVDNYRPYAAARLIRAWTKHNIDIEGCILECLNFAHSSAMFALPDISKLLSELVCSGHFTISRYCQWIISSGLFSQMERQRPEREFHVQLLRNLPSVESSSYVLNLRNSLLRSLDSAVPDEREVLNQVQSVLLYRLFEPQDHKIPGSQTRIDPGISTLSQAMKSAASRYLRHLLSPFDQSRGKGAATTRSINVPQAKSPYSPISTDQFKVASHMLLTMGEFPVLGDIMECVIENTDHETLLLVIDTVNRYSKIFMAIGAARRIHRLTCDRLRYVTDKTPIYEALRESLNDLATRFSGRVNEQSVGPMHIPGASPSSAFAACSPVSDTVIETANHSAPAFLHELDQMLAVGTTMDLQTFSRVFITITGHMTRVWSDAPTYAQFVGLLARLRTFNNTLFAELLGGWLNHILVMEKQPSLLSVIAPLVCRSVLSLDRVVASALSLLQNSKSPAYCDRVVLDIILALTAGKIDPLPELDFRPYRFFNQQEQVISCRFAPILQMFKYISRRRIITENVQKVGGGGQLDKGRLCSLLNELLSTGSLVENGDMAVQAESGQLIGEVLLRLNQDNGIQLDPAHQIPRILNNINDCNVVPRRLELSALLGSGKHSSETALNEFTSLLIKENGDRRPGCISLWAYMLSTIPITHVLPIRRALEIKLTGNMTEDPLQAPQANLAHLLMLLDASTARVESKDVDILPENIFAAISSLIWRVYRLQPTFDCLLSVSTWLEMIVRLIFAYGQSLEDSSLPQTTKRLRILLLLAKHFHRLESLTMEQCDEKLLDVLGILSESLPQEHVSRCGRIIQDHSKPSDSGVDWVLECGHSSVTEWLRKVLQNTSTTKDKDVQVSDTSREKGVRYFFRRWELIADATPAIAPNDTSLSLGLFDARKSVL